MLAYRCFQSRAGVAGAELTRQTSHQARGRHQRRHPATTPLPSKAFALACCLLSITAWAHKASDSYLTLKRDGVTVKGRWDLALKDLDAVITLDADRDAAITWGELKAARTELERYALSHLALSQAGTSCPLSLAGLKVVPHSDGTYAVLELSGRCPQTVDAVELTYSLFFDVDAQHRGLVRLDGMAGDSWKVFSAEQTHQTLTWEHVTASAQLWLAFKEGVHHLAIGFDHLAFLFALLLPSVLKRVQKTWEPAPDFRPALTEVLKVVTSFTLAHSITLGLGAFEVVAPNLKWVEVAIAASVALAAINNLLPFLPEGRWSLAFGLGLLHGFGFSSAMADLGTGGNTAISVLGFNLGVEAGQLMIVAVVVPLLFSIRKTAFFQKYLFRLGSLAITALAIVWVIERL